MQVVSHSSKRLVLSKSVCSLAVNFVRPQRKPDAQRWPRRVRCGAVYSVYSVYSKFALDPVLCLASPC
ncbi:MAG: hypothetical protein V4623_05310, partial [Pseudomonadota bacterium]